jgi:hypothetical protein
MRRGSYPPDESHQATRSASGMEEFTRFDDLRGEESTKSLQRVVNKGKARHVHTNLHINRQRQSGD